MAYRLNSIVMRTLLLLSGILCILLTPGAGWSGDPKAVAKPVSPTHERDAAPKAASKRTATPAMSDSQIEAAIRAKLAKSKIAADKFQVHVQGGVATIE